MSHLFRHHYTVTEARSLLPKVRTWLRDLRQERERALMLEKEVARLVAHGQDAGGSTVHRWIKSLVAIKQLMHEFQTREIQIKDLQRGLIDFPAIIGGREVFLCYEEGEDDIEFWHDVDSGYAGRQPL